MSLFRKKLIFQVDDSNPDAEEMKIRFRRRVLLLTFLGALCLLGFPVFHELRTYFAAQREIRHFAELLLDTRLQAAQSRKPLNLDPFHTEKIRWELRFQKEQSEEVRSATQLSLDPSAGLLVDGTPLNDGKLLVLAYPEEENELKRSAKILITNSGSEINILSE